MKRGNAGKYGYRLSDDGKVLLRVPEEQEVMAIIRELHAGGLTYALVAEELNRRGLRTRKGRTWNKEAANRVVQLY